MEKFGTVLRVGNKRVVSLRYTDEELASDVIRFLKNKYIIGCDFTTNVYQTRGKIITRIEAIIAQEDIYLIMAKRQNAIAKKALDKATILLGMHTDNLF